MQWQDLTDEHVGRRVRFTFPWDEEPTEATLVALVGPMGFARDPDWTPPEDEPAEGDEPATAPLVTSYRNVLDYGGEIGEQETQLAGTLPIELLEPATAGARRKAAHR